MRIGEYFGYQLLEFPKERIQEIQENHKSISEGDRLAIRNALQALVMGVAPNHTFLVGKGNVAFVNGPNAVPFSKAIPEWRTSDFLRAPIRHHATMAASTFTLINEKHVFGDGIVALLPAHLAQELGITRGNGWAQVRIFAHNGQEIRRVWKGVLVAHENVREPLLAYKDGYGEDITGCTVEIFTLLKQTNFEARYTVQGLYYQGIEGWINKMYLQLNPGLKRDCVRAGAPLDLLYPIAQHLGIDYKVRQRGYGGILLSPKILPFLDMAPIQGNQFMMDKAAKPNSRWVFNRRPDLPTGQSAVAAIYAGRSPVPDAVIAPESLVGVTGADYDGDIGYIFPSVENGGLYMPYTGQGFLRKDLIQTDYESGLDRWAGQVQSAIVLGSTEVGMRRYIDFLASQDSTPNPDILEAATLIIQVAVDRQKRNVQWPKNFQQVKAELSVASDTPVMTDLFRLAMPGGKTKPEGNTPTQKITNRWRAWDGVSLYVGNPKWQPAMQKFAVQVSRILDATEKRFPVNALVKIAMVLPPHAPRSFDLELLLRQADLLQRADKLKLYDQIVAQGMATAAQVTDYPELWLQLASVEEMQEVFRACGFVPADQEFQQILEGNLVEEQAVEVPSDLFSDLFAQ